MAYLYGEGSPGSSVRLLERFVVNNATTGNVFPEFEAVG